MDEERSRRILLACVAGAVTNIYLYMILILLSFQSPGALLLFSWPIGDQRIAIFGRIPWCMLAQILATGALHAWWRHFPLPSPRVAYGVILGLIINALLINALVLW